MASERSTIVQRVNSALSKLQDVVRQHYGDRLRGLYRVERGSLLEPEDRLDAEIVVVLASGGWRFYDEIQELTGLTFPYLTEFDVCIGAWPVSLSEWQDPSSAAHPDLVEELKQHSEAILEAA